MDTRHSKNEVGAIEADNEMPAEIPVLIIGGGPVGLFAAIMLAHHGIRSLLVEQHPGTSIYPKARFINARTMELFRALELEQTVRDAAVPTAKIRHAIWGRSLAGEELARRAIETILPEFVKEWSPTFGCDTSQEVLEPILLAHARKLKPVRIRFGTQLVNLSQSEANVTATLVHRASGRVREIRAQYLIGADGAHSQVREALGINSLGPELVSYFVNNLFHADLSRWVGDRSINLCYSMQREAPGVLLAIDGKERWAFQSLYYPDNGQRAEDFTPERCVQLIRAAVGVPDLPLELIHSTPWQTVAKVAERFGDRRVFLVGDAAHEIPPAGGFGMNTGIHEAHNLAWKLAAVVKGWASPTLLETYDRERMPVGRWIAEQTLQSVASLLRVTAQSMQPGGEPHSLGMSLGRVELFHEHGLVFGATYESSAIIPDGASPTQVANPTTDYRPNVHPGSRAPHVWLEREGRQISTLDLFGTGFVLLTGTSGEAWCASARQAAHNLNVPLDAYTIGLGSNLRSVEDSWRSLYDVEGDGVVLIRPDGHVAWRRQTLVPEPATELDRVLRTILRR